MAGLGGNMMQGLRTEGRASYGPVTIAGFYCRTLDFGSKLESLKDLQPCMIDQCEEEGNVVFLAIQNDFIPSDTPMIATYRREPHVFFRDLAHFLSKIKPLCMSDFCLSMSLGSIHLTLLYVPEKNA